MKGIILSGGSASRLIPLTKITGKQLLPVYDKPMIYYPLETLVKAGIKDVLIIVSPEYSGHYLNLLGSGKEFGIRITYEVQDKPRGLADAFILGENFIGQDNVTLILGDNIFEHDFTSEIKSFKKGGVAYAKKVSDPERFGVVEFNEDRKVVSIEEKPEKPKSNYAVVGIYTYDNNVVEYAKSLSPSARGEIEITDINNIYLKKGELSVKEIDGFWEDAGTFDSLLKAGIRMYEKAKNVKHTAPAKDKDIPITDVHSYYLELAKKVAKGKVLKTDCHNERFNKPDGGIVGNLGIPTKDITLLEYNREITAPGLNVVHGDIRSMPFKDNSFDCLLDLSTIDHIHPNDIEKVILEYDRVLRDGSNILIVSWCSDEIQENPEWKPTSQYHFDRAWLRKIILSKFKIIGEERFHTSKNGYLVAFIGEKYGVGISKN